MMDPHMTRRSRTTVLPESWSRHANVTEDVPARRPTTSATYRNLDQKGSFSLFSSMSKEALQAIDEARSELRRNTKTSATAVIHAQPASMRHDSHAVGASKAKPMEDGEKDSAIGTASHQSQFTEHEEDVTNISRSQIKETDNLEVNHDALTLVLTPVSDHHHSSQGHPTSIETHQPKQPPQITMSHQEPQQRQTVVNLNAQRTSERKNVFERLSSNYRPVTRITARQRSQARQALRSMQNSSSYGKGNMPTKGISSQTKPLVLRTLPKRAGSKDYDVKSKPMQLPILSKNEDDTQTEAVVVPQPAQTPVGRPKNPSRLSVSYPRPERQDSRVSSSTTKRLHNQRPITPENHQDDSDYVKPLFIPDLQPTMFQITPVGYDSRYLTLQYQDTLPAGCEDDEVAMEIIKQAKIKCERWLTKQLALTGHG